MTAEKNIFETESQLIGGYIPRSLAEKLMMVTILKGITKSQILRESIETYLDRVGPDSEIIASLASKAMEAWNPRGTVSFDEYKSLVKKDLRRKKVPRLIIRRIIREVNRSHAHKTSRRTN